MDILQEQEEQIVNFGVFEYNAEKIANILGFQLDEVKKEMSNSASKLSVLLQKGKDMADYVIDLKLFDLAKTGDIKAMDKLETRKRLRKNR